MIYILVIVAAAIAALLVISGIWWAVPILIVAVVLYAMRERADGGSSPASGLGSSNPEPTGMPRSNSGGAETANERVGQT